MDSSLQLSFFDTEIEKNVKAKRNNRNINKLDNKDRNFHDWYRFILSYPPHLVRDYIDYFDLNNAAIILDPFCGTGTTLIEAKLQNFQSIGIEANPFAHFACSTKTTWNIDPDILEDIANQVAHQTLNSLKEQGIEDNYFNGDYDNLPLRTLSPDETKLLLKNSISPLPLYKSLVLLNCLKKYCSKDCYDHCLLTLANALVFSISNLHFGPEVGVKNIKYDTPVVIPWMTEIKKIVSDLRTMKNDSYSFTTVHLADSRDISQIIPSNSIDAVITSPPYPNEKDYTRTTRLESVILGFIHNKQQLRSFKQTLVRSNTRGVYKEDGDGEWVKEYSQIQKIANEIEKRRIELGKTSGFEKLYGTVTKLYFGGMARHLAELRKILKPGAQLAYVVGDQASYLRVMIRTGELLGMIAESLGYELVRIDLFRTRFSTATGKELREEVIVLRWKGWK